MPRRPLDATLLEKLHQRTGKPKQYLWEQISRKAARLGVCSLAAQIVWAQDLGVGVAAALNRFPAEIREEVRSVRDHAPIRANVPVARPPGVRHARRDSPITGRTIGALLQDTELRGRCKDLLLRPRHFDRVIREATTVLDDRLKKKTGIRNMNPENLVSKAVSPDPAKAIIEVSADRAEQEGIHSICKGIMLAFRNKAHHSLSEKLTREDALRLCGFVDAVLGVLEQSTLHPERV